MILRSAEKTICIDVCTFAVWSPPESDRDSYLEASHCLYHAWCEDPELHAACRLDRSLWPKWLRLSRGKRLLAIAREYRERQAEARRVLDALGWARAGSMFMDPELEKEFVRRDLLIPIHVTTDCSTACAIRQLRDAPADAGDDPLSTQSTHFLDAASGVVLANGMEYLDDPHDGVRLDVPPGRYRARVTLAYDDPGWRAKGWVGPASIVVDLWRQEPD